MQLNLPLLNLMYNPTPFSYLNAAYEENRLQGYYKEPVDTYRAAIYFKLSKLSTDQCYSRLF